MLNNAISTNARFNECVDADGSVKPVYQPLMKNMEGLGVEELQRRWEKAKGYANQDAFTFFLDPREFRTVPTDWFPRLIPAEHWENISAGVAQRLKAINYFMGDLYHGQQDIVPADVMFSCQY